MGRYYYDQTGNQGKFWFAVQPSDDPKTIYGMSEVEPDDDWDEDEADGYGENYIDYDSSNDEYVKKQLDIQYDILGVPKDERKYECDDGNAYVWDHQKMRLGIGRVAISWARASRLCILSVVRKS